MKLNVKDARSQFLSLTIQRIMDRVNALQEDEPHSDTLENVVDYGVRRDGCFYMEVRGYLAGELHTGLVQVTPNLNWIKSTIDCLMAVFPAHIESSTELLDSMTKQRPSVFRCFETQQFQYAMRFHMTPYNWAAVDSHKDLLDITMAIWIMECLEGEHKQTFISQTTTVPF